MADANRARHEDHGDHGDPSSSTAPGAVAIPTAVDLHEPEFLPSSFPPPPQTNDAREVDDTNASSSSTHHSHSATLVAMESKSNRDDGDVHLGLPGGLKKDDEHVTNTMGERPERPSIPFKYATEAPRPDPKPVRFGLGDTRRAGSVGERLPHLEAHPTGMDPWSSDSSSSDDDDDDRDGGRLANLRSRRGGAEGRGGRDAGGRGGRGGRLKINNEHFKTKGKVSKKDGRLKLSINETLNSGYFAKTLGAGIRKTFKGTENESDQEYSTKIPPEEDVMEDPKKRVRLNIVVIVIGSRGDIQPFLRIGKILKEDYGHRVRIATHPAFKSFVEKDSGLEFFSIGGDPSELMAFMVKNPGLIPNLETVKEGEIGRRRSAMFEMFQGMWRACINDVDGEAEDANLEMMGDRFPFVCDAIIANPPSFAPPHIAERLGVPLHLMFTFPYSPTTQFPHPLANIKASNVDAPYTNFMSYPLVEMMTWQGLGDLINRFRQKTLMLEEVSTLWAPGQLYRLKVPYTYMWSPALVPKPKDWGSEIEVTGFVFLDLASSFKPPDDLVKFLDAGPPPVYIGFGSIVVDDPDAFTKLIYKAVELSGVRALVSKGWGGFGSNENAPDNIFMLENTPHDWLFPKVRAVVHHGGAGTTAIGLKCAKPTMIVPFFGDQPFWGAMVSKAKAGAHDCIPYKKLTAERLAEGIKQCLTDEAQKNVQEIADSISAEGDGAVNAVRSFHRSLPLREDDIMRCSFLPNHASAWRIKNTSIRLSPLAAELLVNQKKVKLSELRLLRHYEWNDFGGPGEPVTGLWGALVDTLGGAAKGVGLVPVQMARSVEKRGKFYEKKWRIQKREKKRRDTLDRANKDLKDGKSDSSAIKQAATEKYDGEKGVTNGSTTNGTAKKDEKDKIEEKDETKDKDGKPNDKKSRPNAPDRGESTLSQLSEPEDLLVEEFGQEAGHGFHKTGSAILKSPMTFSVALTQGFHNAPRLYGDETVRRPPRVTGFHSGIRAGRDELVYGVRDGVTGLWMQPYRGARQGGVLGFMRGVGYGIGGFVLKDLAAVVGPGAYLLKGVDEEFHKKNKPTTYLRRARIMQGHLEEQELSPRVATKAKTHEHDIDGRNEERKQIEERVQKRWKELEKKIREEKKNSRSGIGAALLGGQKHKDGMQIPMKSERPPTSSTQHTAKTNESEAPNGTTNAESKVHKTTSAPPREPKDQQQHYPSHLHPHSHTHHHHHEHSHHDHHKLSSSSTISPSSSNSTPLQKSTSDSQRPQHPTDSDSSNSVSGLVVPGVFKASLEGYGQPVKGRDVEALGNGLIVGGGKAGPVGGVA